MSGTSTRSCGDRRASRRPERDSRPRERTPLPAPGGGLTGDLDLGTKDNLYRNTSPAREVETPQLSFKIKKSLGSRKGWMIMAEDEENCQAQDALKTVIQMIRDMECQVNMSGQRLSHLPGDIKNDFKLQKLFAHDLQTTRIKRN